MTLSMLVLRTPSHSSLYGSVVARAENIIDCLDKSRVRAATLIHDWLVSVRRPWLSRTGKISAGTTQSEELRKSDYN